MATGLLILILALFVFLRTVAGDPRLADVVLGNKGKWTSTLHARATA